MTLRLESEGVDVDTNSGDVGVVLVRLDKVEVSTLTHLETVVAVELEESSDYRVLAGHTLNASHGVTRLEAGTIPPVRVVEGLLTLVGADNRVITRHERITLDNPDELLNGVVEVELELVGRGGDRLATSELENIDEVLVGDLGELTTLISIEVDVINVERSSDEASLGNTVADRVGVTRGGLIPAEVVEGVELEVDTDFVVLESDEGEGKTRVAAEPELEGDVEGVHGGAAADSLREVGLAGEAVIVARRTTLVDEVGELRDVTNHLGITSLLTRLLGELVPDVEPVTIVLIDTLTTDFELNVRDEVVADPVEPAELGTRAVLGENSDLGESSLEVDAVDQVTVTLDGTGDLLTEVGGTVERVLNGLHSEVGVTTVCRLEESNLRVTSEVNILSTIGYELHKTTASHLLYLRITK